MVGSVYEVWQDRRVPKMVIRKATVSRDEGRRQERSRRSSSISRPRSRQPSRDPYGRPREQPSVRHPSQSQRGQQLRGLSPRFASPYDGRYASEDDHEGEDDELPGSPYVSAPEDSRGRRRNPVGASSAAPPPRPYCPPTASTESTVSSHGQGSIRDGDGGRDYRGAAPESLQRDREPVSYGRGGSRRGGVGSNAGVEEVSHPRSPQTFGLSSRQRPHQPQPTPAAPAPAPQPGLRDLLSTTGSRPHYEHPDPGVAPPRHAHIHANNTVPGLQRREGIAPAGYASHIATDTPPHNPPRPSPSLRQRKREPSRSRAAPVPPLASRNAVSSDRNRPYSMTSGRSGMEGEATRKRERATEDERCRRAGTLDAERLAAGMGYEQAYQAGLAEGRRSVRKGDNHEMAGEEGLSAAKPKLNPDPVAHRHPHTSGVSSHEQVPPPPPYNTRPRSFLPQQQPPAHAAASHHPHPFPPSSAAPRPRIHKGIPTASNARDSLFGFSDREERDNGGEDRCNRRADGLESTLRENYYTRAGGKGSSTANAPPQPSSGQRRRSPPPPPNVPGRSDSRPRPLREMPQQQQRQRPGYPAAAPSASDCSDVSNSSSSAVSRYRDLPASATSRGNANAKVPSTVPHGGRVGAATTGPKPEPRLGPKREAAESVSGYGSARGREKTEVPRHPSLRTREPAIPQQQRRPAAAAAAAPPASDCSDSSVSSSVIPPSRNPAATSRGNANAKVPSTGPRGGRVGVANTGPRPGPKRERVNSVGGYGSATGRERAKVPEPPSIPTGGRATPQQRRHPTYPAAAAAASPPAHPAHSAHPVPTSRNPRPSTSIPPHPRNPVQSNGTNTAPRAGVLGARSTFSTPRTAPSLRRGAESISGYGSTRGRERVKVPRSPRIKSREPVVPQRQRRPTPPLPAPRDLPPYSSTPSPSYTPLHANGRARAIGTRNTASTPIPRNPAARSVSFGHDHGYRGGSRRSVPNYFPNRPSSPRWGEPGSGKRREEPKPTLTQRIGYRLWITALGCL